MMRPQELWTMGLHEEKFIDHDNSVTRVPGGWIYTRVQRWQEGHPAMTSTFVPFTIEGRKSP